MYNVVSRSYEVRIDRIYYRSPLTGELVYGNGFTLNIHDSYYTHTPECVIEPAPSAEQWEAMQPWLEIIAEELELHDMKYFVARELGTITINTTEREPVPIDKYLKG